MAGPVILSSAKSDGSSGTVRRSKTSKIAFVFVFCFSFSFLSGFSGQSAVQPSPDNEKAVDFVNANIGHVHNVKAFIELEVNDDASKSSLNTFGQIAVRRSPFQLYFKAFSPLNPHHLTLISRGNRFWLKVPKLRTIYKGPLEATAQEAFELKISPQDFEWILFPEPIEKTGKIIRAQTYLPYMILSLSSNAGQTMFKEREIWIEDNTFQIVKDIRYSPQQTPYLEIRREAFLKDASGKAYPTMMTLTHQPTKRRVTLRLKKWETDTAFPDTLFDPPSEEGYKIETVE